jgi:hypothetical protein
VASCASASLHVEQLCRQAGLAATTRIGWVVGMEMVHAWVEIIDDDGLTKVIDPVFALFATMAPGANPIFRDLAFGLRSNRLVPSGLPAGAALAYHTCGARRAAARITTKIRPMAAERS